ncbi:MAG TPA: V-type ATPase 116kDa subunit family protein [Gemmatimonadales bacterium]
MLRVRLLGPRERLESTLTALQDAGVVHLADTRINGSVRTIELSEPQQRQIRHLRSIAAELDVILKRTSGQPSSRRPPGAEPPADFARWARRAHRIRRDLERIDGAIHGLEAERVELVRFAQFVRAFHGLLPGGVNGRMKSYHLVLRGEDRQAVPRLREALAAVIGEEFVLESTQLPSGELAAALLVHAVDATRVERLLAQAGVGELPIPPRFARRPLGELLPELDARRGEVDRELGELRDRQAGLTRDELPPLAGARRVVADRLLTLEAQAAVGATARSFVVEGWVPGAMFDRVARLLATRAGPEVVMETIAREEWKAEDAPVVLRNPRLFRPFETVTAMLPLPRYGTIDPTPFVGVFFPMFFGLIMGDIGYGLVLAVLALWLRRRGGPGSTVRSIGEVLGACAGFSVLFGLAFGEFLGDLGRRWFGLHPLVLDREEALLPFLGLSLAIGFVHILIGLVLGIVNNARGHPRHAVGKTASLVMLITLLVSLLAAVEVLPGGFFTPAVVILLLAFPVLVVAEGIIAPIEFLSTVSNVLSYARIMALGTASVMMAAVANRLAGTMGGVLVGLLFGLLFHLVNFALGIFAPTIHGLRLHYVEFFGKFYSPGGQQYRPFTHWRPDGVRAA